MTMFAKFDNFEVNLYNIVLVTYVTVKGEATRKKPWRQGKTAPTILVREELEK